MLAQEAQTETGVGVGSFHSVLPKQLSSVLEFRMRNCASPVPWGGLAAASHPVFSGEMDPDETHLAKGMKIRILASEFKSCLHGNPPTVWKKSKKILKFILGTK